MDRQFTGAALATTPIPQAGRLMANTKGRRRFGWVRKLPSGRYQASYLGPDGSRINGPETYEGRGDADQWLSTVESDMLRGEWTDPRLGRVQVRRRLSDGHELGFSHGLSSLILSAVMRWCVPRGGL